MKKISAILIGIVTIAIGILSIPKENKQVLIEEELNDENTSLAFYIEQENGNYEESSSLPNTGYTLDTERSICTNNTTPVWEDDRLYLDNLQNRGTSCYLYFKIYNPPAGDQILENYDTILTRDDFSVTVTETTTGTIYYEDTSKGRTYYFAGNPTDNWVQFGGFYWRIIRINEDGTLRLIYQGTVANTIGAQIQASAFNSTYTDNMYAGYMYENNQVHGLTSNSTIKEVLDTWYQNNLIEVADKIDKNVGFCGDRTPTSGTGLGASYTEYAAYNRLYINKLPIFECQNSSDLYTAGGSDQGNKAQTYPIGLITADEVAYAGGVYGINNQSFYLYTNQDYWTMTPYQYNNDGVYVFSMWSGGNLTAGWVNRVYGVRPVINLKADVTISGSGTTTDPYVVN